MKLTAKAMVIMNFTGKTQARATMEFDDLWAKEHTAKDAERMLRKMLSIEFHKPIFNIHTICVPTNN